MSHNAQLGLFPDGDMYSNPFVAMEKHGKDWAMDGMAIDEMTAAAYQLGGVALGRNGPENLTGYARELRSQLTPQVKQQLIDNPPAERGEQ